jgi:hypothetical protein
MPSLEVSGRVVHVALNNVVVQQQLAEVYDRRLSSGGAHPTPDATAVPPAAIEDPAATGSTCSLYVKGLTKGLLALRSLLVVVS